MSFKSGLAVVPPLSEHRAPQLELASRARASTESGSDTAPDLDALAPTTHVRHGSDDSGSTTPIAFHRPFRSHTELGYLEQALCGALDGGRGFSDRCERWLTDYLGSPVILTPSCTSSLEMAALLLRERCGERNEVILPSFTFPSTANAFVLHGFQPVFVEIQADDGNLDPKAVERAMTSRTGAIAVVHYAGAMCDMRAIMSIANAHGIYVVEDAAQALFAEQDGRPAGTWGTFGCFSFHDTKNVSCGEGGALAVNDASFTRRAECARDKGTDRAAFMRGEVARYRWVTTGGSFLPSELQAAVLLARLEVSEVIQLRRRRVFERYVDGLSKLAQDRWIRMPRLAQGVTAACHLFHLNLTHPELRAPLIDFLAEQGIDARTHFVPLHSAPCAIERGFRSASDLPITDAYAETLVRLPLYPDLSLAQVDFVVRCVESFFYNR